MKKGTLLMGTLFAAAMWLTACTNSQEHVKIGVSMGVGAAERWDHEADYMEERAKELDGDIEVRINRTGEYASQERDCKEMIDGGVDVLILTPNDASKVSGILDYAKQKKVPVISYARVVLGEPVDLFVGYDSSRIGQMMGQYLSEMVCEGDYIILRGDSNDNNAGLLYEGAMRYITSDQDQINILLDAPVTGWNPEEAKKLVKEALSLNGNHVDAILAPNDKLAGACAEALLELGVKEHVAITGMDAELDAVRRIIEGKQDITVYMNLQELASTAVNEAVHMAKGEKVNVNAAFDNQSEQPVDANLITGHVITKENIDKVLIESGYYTKEQVYGVQ